MYLNAFPCFMKKIPKSHLNTINHKMYNVDLFFQHSTIQTNKNNCTSYFLYKTITTIELRSLKYNSEHSNSFVLETENLNNI